MREIKFRVWDNELKTWIWNLGMKPNNVLVDGKEKGRFSVLQYTGLKDKNGKEIYEGDIVKYTLRHDFSNKELIVEVEWFKYAWRLNSLWLLTEIYMIEVIGNVFENPEHVQFNIQL